MSPTAKLPSCKITGSYIYLLMEVGSIGTVSSARLVKYETIFNSVVHFKCRATQQSRSYCCTGFRNREAYYVFNDPRVINKIAPLPPSSGGAPFFHCIQVPNKYHIPECQVTTRVRVNCPVNKQRLTKN